FAKRPLPGDCAAARCPTPRRWPDATLPQAIVFTSRFTPGPAMFMPHLFRRRNRRPAAPAPRRTIPTFECLEARDVPSITISPATRPAAKDGVKYLQALSASGGTAPYKFDVTTGSLPAGIALTNGTLHGYPKSVGSFSFTITATDSAKPAQTGSQPYTLTVN